ncbi:hypothetical protein [Streptococcus gallolyticus]|uniref:Uncharacterized protein n=1 Tax=Streptococcus gallolyticus TaxID=315405 RepID=A0A1H9PBT5_9STRE|nr:hypothetical protein [Streptococcus gallolyticus]MCY7177378.1 hypothetical protein [Streptococcus gallolyticus subsp. gallolyticus]MCY7194045.1 hypothetical protein [Streptococcus gallolyticus subsp. gallolyticus]SER45627.1 hypothetical protein SAMN04487840_10465 [Streptococcus gallolyticus]
MDILNLSTSAFEMAPVIGAGVDISNLRSFMSGDAIYVIGVVAAIFIAKFWKDGSIVKIFGILMIYAIIAILLKGTQMLNFLSGILEWFGINSGL